MQLFDSHCHLDFEEFDHDRDEVIRDAKKNAINGILVPATQRSQWSRSIRICRQYSIAHLALGLHPYFTPSHREADLSRLKQLMESTGAVAVGECGIDKLLDSSTLKQQMPYFEAQVALASELGLPLILHVRKLHDICIATLAQHQLSGGIVHAFNGSIQQAEKYADMGFVFGFGGMLTYPRSRKLRSLARQLPISQIVLETDAPDATVMQYRGQRNSPAYLNFVLDSLSELKQMDVTEVAQHTTLNAKRILSL